jgi:hypothetical protein
MVDNLIFEYTYYIGSENSKLFIKILLFINRLVTIQSTNDSLFDVVNIPKSVFRTGRLNGILVLFYQNGCIRIVSIKYTIFCK